MFFVFFLFVSEKNARKPENYGDLTTSFQKKVAITIDGVDYSEKKKIESFLFVGTDKREDSKQTASEKYRSGGQSDFLMLVVVDHEKKQIDRIQIDRDTMAEITVLGLLGNDMGTSTHQICLAHSFGASEEQSAQYTAEAVSRLFYGIPIEGYVVLNMTGINELNDVLGGVTVTIADDFSAYDPTMIPGATIKLQGEQAEIYVRYRQNISDGSNASRMIRQQDFLTQASDTIALKLQENSNFINEIFDSLDAYLSTDLSRGRFINEVNKAGKYSIAPIVSLEGEHTIGDSGFVEFHLDKAALLDFVLSTFYTPTSSVE